MTLFQAVIYAIIGGFSTILPISLDANFLLVRMSLGWAEPDPLFLGVFSAASGLALIVYFRDDWLSIVFSFLRVVLYWKKPMTLDERLPFFIILTLIPYGAAWYYIHSFIDMSMLSPYAVATSLVVFGLIMGIADSLSRRTKNILSWNVRDSIIFGFVQVAGLFPGAGRQALGIFVSSAQNYQREAAVKFTLLTLTPIAFIHAALMLRNLEWGGSGPTGQISWLVFGVAFSVAFLSSLLAIGGLYKAVQRRGFNGYIFYRVVLAVGIALTAYLYPGN